MKYLLTCASLLVLFSTSIGIAAEGDIDRSGYYMGLNLGYADHHLNENGFFQNNSTQTLSSRNTNGFAGRFSAGYAFSSNLGLEAGATYLYGGKAEVVAPTSATIKSQTYLLDFLFRSSLQFYHNFSLYGKLGIAYINSKITYSNNPDSRLQAFRPAFALGTGYDLTQNITMSIEWYRLLGNDNAYDGYAQTQQVNNGGSFTKLPAIDLFTAGITYRF